MSGSVSQPRAGNAGQPRERVSRQWDGCDTVSDQVTKILLTLFGYSLHSCGGYRCPGATFSAAQSSFGSTCRASAAGPPHAQCYCPLTPNAAPSSPERSPLPGSRALQLTWNPTGHPRRMDCVSDVTAPLSSPQACSRLHRNLTYRTV